MANAAIYPWFVRPGVLGVSDVGAGVSTRARKDAWMGGLPEIEALRRDEVGRGKDRAGAQRTVMGCGLCFCLGGFARKA